MQFRIPSRRSKEKNTFIGICTHWYANFNLFLLLLLFYTVHCYFKISKGILFIYTVSFGRILGSLWACLFLHFELTISGTPKHMCFANFSLRDFSGPQFLKIQPIPLSHKAYRRETSYSRMKIFLSDLLLLMNKSFQVCIFTD